MVTHWGFSEELGTVMYGDNRDEVFLGYSIGRQQTVSEATAQKIDAEVCRLVEAGLADGLDIISESPGSTSRNPQCEGRLRANQNLPGAGEETALMSTQFISTASEKRSEMTLKRVKVLTLAIFGTYCSWTPLPLWIGPPCTLAYFVGAPKIAKRFQQRCRPPLRPCAITPGHQTRSAAQTLCTGPAKSPLLCPGGR